MEKSQENLEITRKVIKCIELLQSFPTKKEPVSKAELLDIVYSIIDELRDKARTALTDWLVDNEITSIKGSFGEYKLSQSKRSIYKLFETKELFDSYGLDITPALEIRNGKIESLIREHKQYEEIKKDLEEKCCIIDISDRLTFRKGK